MKRRSLGKKLLGLLTSAAMLISMMTGIVPMTVIAEDAELELVTVPEGAELVKCKFRCKGSKTIDKTIYVAYEGEDVYIQGLAAYFPAAYVKGSFNSDKSQIIIPGGQYVGSDEEGPEYICAASTVGDGWVREDNIIFYYNSKRGVLSQKDGIYILEASTPSIALCWNYFKYGEIIPESQLVPVAPPAGLETEEWQLDAQCPNDSGKYDDCMERVRIGFDGDDLYIYDLYDTEFWVKATKNADGKYVVPENQYMGSDFINGIASEYYFSAVEGNKLVDTVLTYDPDEGTMITDQKLIVNSSATLSDPYKEYKNVVFTKVVERAAYPADPKVVEFAPGNTYPYAKFKIPLLDTEGRPVATDKVFYKVYYLKDGQTKELIIRPDDYKYIEEDTSEIPYSFEDYWDIHEGGRTFYLNQSDAAGWEAIGVQSIYYGGGERHVSNVAWHYADPATVSIAPETNTFTYNSSEQPLVTAGTAEKGVMQYAIGADDKNAPATGWSENIPKGKDAGDYYVWYRASDKEDKDVSDPECVKARINEKAVTITASGATKTYDGSALTAGDFSATELEPGDTHIFTVVMTAPSTITNAGSESNVIASVDGETVTTGTEKKVGNYLVTTVDGTLTVEPKEVTITARDGSFVYDGSPKSEPGYDVEGLVGDDEITAVVTGGITYPVEGPVDNKVESYEFTKGNADNYTVITQNGVLTMTKADLAVTVSGYDGDYDAEAHGITVGIGDSDAVVYYGSEELTAENYNITGSTENPQFTEAGEYTVYFYIVSDGYEADIASGSGTVNISKAEPSYTAPAARELVYTGEFQELLDPGSTEDGTMVYVLDGDGDYLDDNAYGQGIPTRKDPGTYGVWFKILGDDNHLDTEPQYVEVTIAEEKTDESSEPDDSISDDSESTAEKEDSSSKTDSSESESDPSQSTAAKDTASAAANAKATNTASNPNTGAATAAGSVFVIALAAVVAAKKRR